MESIEIASAKEFHHYLSSYGIDHLALIFTEAILPDGSSLEVINSYKKICGIEDIPFIVISAQINSELFSKSLEVGAKDILIKPVNQEKLQKKVDRILSVKLILQKRKSVRNYYDQIRNEVKRAQRGNYNLSLFLAGIFSAENLNAYYRESSYRQVIDLEKRYPFKLQAMIRETDSIFNLSPSDHLFFFPFTNKEGMQSIRSKIEQMYINTIPEEERNSLLLVTGSATFDQDGNEPDELIAKLETEFKDLFSKMELDKNDLLKILVIAHIKKMAYDGKIIKRYLEAVHIINSYAVRAFTVEHLSEERISILLPDNKFFEIER